MDNDIRTLQIKMQMNTRHLIVLYQKGERIREYDMSSGIEEWKKKICNITKTKRFLLGDESAEPDLNIMHENPHASAIYWCEYGPEDQDKREKEFIQGLSSDIKKLQRNIDRTIKLTQDYYFRKGDDMVDEFKKYIEEVVEKNET